LEWVEITHPFHPLRGQRFPVLKTRNLGGQDYFNLKGSSSGTFCILREWTDQADPDPFALRKTPPPVLSVPHLLELVRLFNSLDEPATLHRGPST
jgi:hypothetical protein